MRRPRAAPGQGRAPRPRAGSCTEAWRGRREAGLDGGEALAAGASHGVNPAVGANRLAFALGSGILLIVVGKGQSGV